MLQDERRRKIMELLREKRTMNITVLAEYFDVSIITIRRDLSDLASRGLVKKIYGGVSIIETAASESITQLSGFIPRVNKNIDLKERIGMVAAQQIEEGDSIILDIGTTCLKVAEQIKGFHDITVLTNSLAILNELVTADFEVNTLGGTLQKRELSLTGSMACKALSGFCVDKAFISIGAVSLENGLTNYNNDSAELCSAVIQRASHVYLVADSSKFGKNSFCIVGGLDSVDTVITDSGIPQEFVDAFKANNTQVIIVP